MSSQNATNFRFLKDFKLELHKLAVPVSMLAYATRFLEYILYEMARDNGHEVNRETGFVNNIYELIQLDYHYVLHIINLCEHGFLYKTALKHVDVNESDLNRRYNDKKSDFIDGNKDDLFVKYNELLIEDLFKSLRKNNVLSASEETVEFWMNHFDGFSERLSDKLSRVQLRLLLELFKTDLSKDDILNRFDIHREELEIPIENPSLDRKSQKILKGKKDLCLSALMTILTSLN